MRSANAFMDLVFHALAFVPPPATDAPVAVAASLYDEAYVKRARRELPEVLSAPFDEHATLLSTALRDPEVATTIQLFACLHDDLADVPRFALRDLAEVPDDHCVAEVRDALVRIAPLPAEILRTSFALAAPAWERHHREVLRPRVEIALAASRETWRALEATLPAIRGAGVVMSATLGDHGRGLGDRIVVGASASDPMGPLHFAIHELAVGCAMRALGNAASWRMSERAALEAVERALAGTDFSSGYVAWRSRFDLRRIARADEVSREIVDAVHAALGTEVIATS